MRKVDTRILTYVTLLIYSCIFVAIFFSSYINAFDFLRIISFRPDDGHCDPAVEGIGVHCFGDYWYLIRVVREVNPWINSQYPPLVIYLFKFFSYLDLTRVTGQQALYAYLVVSFLSLISPLIIYWQKIKQDLNLFFPLISICLFSIGSLSIIDRGNSTVFLIPLLVLFFKALSKNKFNESALWTILIISIRPQFLTLILIFFGIKKIKLGLQIIVLSLMLNLVLFALWPNETLLNTVKFFTINLISYNDYWAIDDYTLSNLSIFHSLAFIFYIFKEFGFETEIALNVMQNNSGVLGVALVVFVAVCILISSKHKGLPQLSVISILVAIFFPGVTYVYYSVVLLVIFFLPIIFETQTKEESRFFQLFEMNKLLNFLFKVGLTLLVVPFFIKFETIFPGPESNLNIAPISVLVGQVLLGIFMIVSSISKQQQNCTQS